MILVPPHLSHFKAGGGVWIDLLQSSQKLLNTFGNEMTILNKVTFDDLESVAGEKLAKIIDESRNGKVQIQAGGGGVYGKVSIF